MNKKLLIIIGAVVILATGAVVAIASIGQSNDSSNQNKAAKNGSAASADMKQAPNTVVIEDYTFIPETIRVTKGTTITWMNRDSAKHTAEVIEGQTPGGPTGEKLMAKNETYQYTFNTVGTFKYKCGPHPYMRATVEVTE